MNLYKIWQDVNNNYDSYDSAVVVAPSEEVARTIHPNGWDAFTGSHGNDFASYNYDWAFTLEQVKVKYLGKADPLLNAGVVVASYNAG